MRWLEFRAYHPPKVWELQSKLLKDDHIGDEKGKRYTGYQGGVLWLK